MSVECIHGLDEALCDLCNPKPAPIVEPAAPKVSRPRSAPARARVAGAAGPSVTSIDQRIYHLTHLRNLENILESGCLLADSGAPGQAVDISSADNREARRSAVIDTGSADVETVADFVPFFLSPEAALWQSIRMAVSDPRLAPAVRQFLPAEFVILVSTVGKAGREDSVIAVGDAAHTSTRFATTPELAARELSRMRDDEDMLARAELLVRGRLPFEAVTLIGAANDKARNEVREILAASHYDTKVSIYPPWFARTEG